MAALPSLTNALHCSSIFPVSISAKADAGFQNGKFSSSRILCVSAKRSDDQSSSSGDHGKRSSRRIWRRRKLTKKDDMSYKMDRIPFLEEQVRKIRDTGKLMTLDIEKLMLREENRFDFVNEVAEEAKMYVERNRDEYGAKKPILHVLSNRMNEAGFYRPEAYMETDPFKPGPTYLKEEDV